MENILLELILSSGITASELLKLQIKTGILPREQLQRLYLELLEYRSLPEYAQLKLV